MNIMLSEIVTCTVHEILNYSMRILFSKTFSKKKYNILDKFNFVYAALKTVSV